jgi:hypothetical protein
MKLVPLSQGKVAMVDDADFAAVSEFNWFAYCPGRPGLFYAMRNAGHGRGNRRTQTMHRFICGLVPGDGFEVDHEDGDGLNNQRWNLRVCTHQENHRNLPKRRTTSTSRFKGVTWDAGKKRWLAQVYTGGRNRYIGRFDHEEQAAQAYDQAAREQFGEFARLNFPEETS